MEAIQTPSDIDIAWLNLRARCNGLPAQLRPPQRDALFWLLHAKSVFICIGTGGIKSVARVTFGQGCIFLKKYISAQILKSTGVMIDRCFASSLVIG